MWESFWQWLKFWGNCIHDGFEVWDYLFGISEFLLVFIIGYLTYRKRHHHAKQWEERSVKWVWLILGVSFAVSTIFVAPFLKFQEADSRKTTHEKFDYINQNRPYLEPQLVIDSIESNTVFYHYQVQNTGVLPASSISEEQKSPYFAAPEFEIRNRFLAPQAKMSVNSDVVFIPE